MTTRSLRWGALAAGGLVAFYATVLVASAGWAHLGAQARQDWWLLAPIVMGMGTQVALAVELRSRHRAAHIVATAGTSAGASTVGMVACCAHHLAELLPAIGATSVAAALFDWRVPIMLAGIAINAVVITVAARRLRQNSRPSPGVAACAA